MTLVYLAVAWAVGIWLSHILHSQGVLGCDTPGWAFAAAVAVPLAAAVILRRNPPARLAAVLVACTVLGGWRYHAQPLALCITPADLAYYHRDDTTVRATLEGVVAGYPELRDTQVYYKLTAASVSIGSETHPVSGLALVRGPRFPAYAYGDRLRVIGLLAAPPIFDDFDYRAYLARTGIHSLMNRAQVELVDSGEGNALLALLYRVRGRAAGVLDRILPEPAASLTNGILLGIESSIPKDLDEAFQTTGTSHIIVISGSNIALFTGLLMAALTRFLGRRRAALPVIALIGLYVLLVGADPAALRAGLMGGLFVLAIYLGRQSTAYVSLCAAGMVMTVLNPLTLWDLGFQLSFLATLGLILFARPIQARMGTWLDARTENENLRRAARPVFGVAAMTLAAQITTMPLLVYIFGRLSLISLATNLLVVPVQPAVMTGGLAALIGGLLWEPLGRVLAVIPWVFLTWTTTVVRLAAAVPFGAVDVGATGRMLAAFYYVALVAALLWREAHNRGWIGIPVSRVAAIIGAVALPIWLAASVLAALPDGRLHMTYIPGESSEAALIVTPAGQRVWVARGDGGEGLANAARAVLIPQLPPGAALSFTDELTLTRLACGDEPVLLLAYHDFRTLLPATLTLDEQECLVRHYRPDELRLTVLKTPQPGTGVWPLAALVDGAAPQLVLWPEGTAYPPAVDAALMQSDAVRVPDGAAVEVTTDGERMWVRQKRTDQ